MRSSFADSRKVNRVAAAQGSSTGGIPATPPNWPAVLIPELDIVDSFSGGKVLVDISVDVTFGAAGWVAVAPFIDGGRFSSLGPASSSTRIVQVTAASEQQINWHGLIQVPRGIHRISAGWWSNAVMTFPNGGAGTARHMSVVEL